MIELLTVKEASEWFTKYLHKTVSTANIAYLIQYGRIKKHGINGAIQVDKQDLIRYYDSHNFNRESSWKEKLVDDYDIYLVANDKYNLYPIIADNCKMKITNQYKRPVLNRTEKDKGAYSEIIFHLKEG